MQQSYPRGSAVCMYASCVTCISKSSERIHTGTELVVLIGLAWQSRNEAAYDDDDIPIVSKTVEEESSMSQIERDNLKLTNDTTTANNVT